ncbi:MAG: histidine--tRNA ligase [Myxococcaceae bacterium]|nr:histidine--tRNA ligase [Myxococcaceae bacterium]
MSQKYAAVKGMNDLLPPDIAVWQHVERTARKTLLRYGFHEIRTPIVEDTALFVRSVGEGTDIVGKEMYTFDDKGGRSITLRPEGTASAARAYIEHAMHQKEAVTRWFYMGPMFRYERMKTGRYRQFYQLGVEAYGVAEPAQDVEVMECVMHWLQELGLKDVKLQVNSLGDETCRPAFAARVKEYFEAHREQLSPDALETLSKNPLRLFDSKEEALKPLIAKAPILFDSLDDASRNHFTEVTRQLSMLGVPYELNPRLVRGLDYYTRTVFEFIAADPVLGTASAVGGGGRYDNLISELGGPKTPAVGFAMGLDRLALLLNGRSDALQHRPDLFLVSVDAAAHDEVMRLARSLRHQGLAVEFDARAGSVKSQMKRADKSRAMYALVLGEKELAEQKGNLKPMREELPAREVQLEDLARVLKGLG